jgi:hypothetical protein
MTEATLDDIDQIARIAHSTYQSYGPSAAAEQDGAGRRPPACSKSFASQAA